MAARASPTAGSRPPTTGTTGSPVAASSYVPVHTASGTRSTKHERIRAVKVEALPDAFRRNSFKESLVLEYVDNFRQQFVQLYPDRAPLLLSPRNEAGVPKFVCTTLRPSLLPLRDLYDLQACARFVAAFVRYEPLEKPTEVPAYLPSPYFTLQTRAGDAFDMSTVLASYLLGSGYDAYVVCGTAPRWITLREEDRSRCEWAPPPDAINREEHTTPAALSLIPAKPTTLEVPGVSRYKLPPPPSLSSEYLRLAAEKAEAEAKKAAASEAYESEEETSDAELDRLRRGIAAKRSQAARIRSGAGSATPTPLPTPSMRRPLGGIITGLPVVSRPLHAFELGEEDAADDAAAGADPLEGRRVHAWVLVRAGKREITEHLFVEASTGHIYTVAASPYLAVESVWNHHNYHVNMQAQPLLPRQPLGAGSQLADALHSTLLASEAALPSGRSHPGSLLRRGKTPVSTRSGRSAGSASLVGPIFGSTAASTGVAGRFVSPYAALVDGTGMAAAGGAVPAGAPRLDGPVPVVAAAAAAKRPPLRGELTHRTDGGAGTAVRVPLTPAGDATGRSRSRSRSRSRGRKPGSASTVRRDLSATQGVLQAQVADMLMRQGEGVRDVGSLGYDFHAEDDWEGIMLALPDTAGKGGADDTTGAAGVSPLDLGRVTGGSGGGGSGVGDGGGSGGGSGASDAEGKGEGKDGGEGAGAGAGGARSDGGGEGGSGAGGDGGGDGGVGRSGLGAATRFAAAAASSAAAAAALPIEHDGEHILDLPESWCPRLVLDRYISLQAYGPTNSHVTTYYRARLEQFVTHSHPLGLVTRYTEYEDSQRTRPRKVVEVFARRKDGMVKRVRHVSLQTTEQHFEKDHFAGIALMVDVLGKRSEMYFFRGARVDGLLKRVHDYGVKITEFYGDTPNRLWYRSITLQPAATHTTAPMMATPPAKAGATAGGGTKTSIAAALASDGPSALTVEIAPPQMQEVEADDDERGRPTGAGAGAGGGRRGAGTTAAAGGGEEGKTKKVLVPVEQAIRKMTEKYRRDPSGATPAHSDMAKVIYLLDDRDRSIQVNFHHADGRITACSRIYKKPSGTFETLSLDPFAPVPRPYDTDNEFRRLMQMEKECHAAARARARACLEIVARRVSDEVDAVKDRTIFEVALDRARTGAPLEDEPEQRTESTEIDYLLPFLLAAKCADPNNPTEKEAREADRACRLAYKERLLERVAIIQKRLEMENDDLMRRQQAFSRNRDHAEGAEEEFDKYCSEATFRIGILEQRLERQEALVTRKYLELEQRLAADMRLAVIHNPAALAARGMRAGGAGGGRDASPTSPAGRLRGAMRSPAPPRG